MSTEKQYAPMSAKERTFSDGGAIINLSCKADKMVAWISQHANAKGYVNLCVVKRRAVGQYGDTHTVYLDPWQPSERADQQPARRDSEPNGAAKGRDTDDQSMPF